MRWTVHSVTALALVTCASWADLNGAGHLGFHQSLTSIHDDVTKRQPIAVRSARGAHHRFGGHVDSRNLSKTKESKVHKTFPKDSTQFYDFTEVTILVNGATESSISLSDTTKVSDQVDGTTEVSVEVDDVTQVSPQADDFREVSTQVDAATEIRTVLVDDSEASTNIDEVVEPTSQLYDVTSPSTWSIEDTSLTTWINGETSASRPTLITDVTEDIQSDSSDQISFQLDFTDVSNRLDDAISTVTSIEHDDITTTNAQANGITETRSQLGATQVDIQPNEIIEISAIHKSIMKGNITQFIYVKEGNTQLSGSMTQINDVIKAGVHSDGLKDPAGDLGNGKQSSAREVVVGGNGTTEVLTEGETTEVTVGGESTQGTRVDKGAIEMDTADRGGKKAERALKRTAKGLTADGMTSTVTAMFTTEEPAHDATEAATDVETTAAAGYDTEALREERAEVGITVDEHGFVVSRSEEEQVDQEDDLRIYEAVVTSMAQWQLHKLNKMNQKRVKRDEEVVCYTDLGCFRDEGPFDYLDMLPSPPEEINTRFLLYTRERGEREKVIRPHNISTIVNSHYNTSRPTKLLIHGFGSSCFSVWIREMRVALLTMMDVNIICVDWQRGAEVPNYVRAASNTRLVGRQVALLLETLITSLNTTLDDFHLIGFSLGAHVSGHAGARLKNLSRISGMDPAGPLFESYSPSVRLDYTDARFVDVIHTNADSLLMGGLGAFEPMGHVDFYPNGGRMQKGCANLFVGGVSDILWPTEGDGRYLCNHRRGYKYYLNSVAPICTFPAFACRDYETFLKGDCFPCKSCGNMGYFSNKAEGRGQLYLVTRDTEPFCANQYKVMVHHSGGPPAEPVTTYGRLDITFIAADGINETLQISQSEDTVMEAGLTTVRILVPHPAITDIHAIQLRYTAYHGWIYSGFNRWAIDKISLMDSFGKMLSFCHRGTTLISGKAMHLTLLPGDCEVRDVPILPPGPSHHLTDPLQEAAHPHEIENEVHQVPSLQLAVAPHKEPPHNATLPHRPFNLTHHVPPPRLTPTGAHDTIITPHQRPTLFTINSEVSSTHKEIPQGFYNASRLRPPHVIMPNTLPSNLSGKTSIKPPPSRYSAGGNVVTSPVPVTGRRPGGVAISIMEPVNVIPAPDLARLPSPYNFSLAPAVYKHESGQVSNTPGNTHTPGTVQMPISIQTPTSAHTPVYLHSTTPVSVNHTQNHSVVVSGVRLTTENSLTVPTSPAIALLPLDTRVASTTTPVNRNDTNKTFSMQVTIVSPSINLHTDIDGLASSIKALNRDDNKADSMLGSTINPVTPKGSTQLPLSTLVMPNTQHRQPDSSSPLPQPPTAWPVTSITPTARPQWLSITQFSGDLNTDRVDIIPPAQLVRSPTSHTNSPLSVAAQIPQTQTEFKNEAPAALNTNSLIDGEIPERERARALELGPGPSNAINPPNFSFDCSSSSCSSQKNKERHTPSVSSTPYISIPTHASNVVPQQTHIHQPPPPETLSRVDTPPRPHFRYASPHVEDSQSTETETVFAPASSSQLRFRSPAEDQPRPLTHDTPARASVTHGHLPASFLDNPLRPPPLRPPPETIIGRGRAPQPTLDAHSQDPWMHRQSQHHHQGSHVDHDIEKMQIHEQQPSLEQYETKPQLQYQQQHPQSLHQQLHHSHQQQQSSQQYHSQQHHHNSEHQIYHIRSQVQQPSEQHSVSLPMNNMTQINLEVAPERPPRPVPAPAPFYVQLLPPSFSHLPHLETFSLPRESRKPQEVPNRKRGGSVGGRASRGRSLSLPAPGGRAAVFTPMVLQVQENHRGRYIPLRHIPDSSLPT